MLLASNVGIALTLIRDHLTSYREKKQAHLLQVWVGGDGERHIHQGAARGVNWVVVETIGCLNCVVQELCLLLIVGLHGCKATCELHTEVEIRSALTCARFLPQIEGHSKQP